MYTTNINGTKVWYSGGAYHRTDGPAIEYCDGRVEWWRNGKRLDPNFVIVNKYYNKKYHELVKSMILYQVHNS